MKYLIVIILLYFGFSLQGQDNTLPNSELYKKSKILVEEKKYKEARRVVRILIERKPNDVKYRLIIARTYLWEKRFDKAEEQVLEILAIKDNHLEAFQIWFKSKLWNDDYESAIEVLNKALEFHPSNEYFLLQKAKLLVKLRKEKEAIQLLKQVLVLSPSNQEAGKLLRSLKAKVAKNRFGFEYLFNYYSLNEKNPLNGIVWSYRRTTSIGSVIFRSNHFNRFGKWGHQMEVDMYPRLFKGVYTYGNFGYSYTSLFPVYRGGFEPFFKLPKSMECSAGFRYLKFENSDVLMYTGSLGKYFGSNWISLRTFITPKDVSFSRSASLEFRHFIKDARNFYFVRTGVGASPDEQNLNVNIQNVLFVPSYKIGVGINKSFIERWFMSVSASAENQILESGNNLLISFNTSLDYAF